MNGKKLADILNKQSYVSNEELQYVLDNLPSVADFLAGRGAIDVAFRYRLIVEEYTTYKNTRIQRGKWTENGQV